MIVLSIKPQRSVDPEKEQKGTRKLKGGSHAPNAVMATALARLPPVATRDLQPRSDDVLCSKANMPSLPPVNVMSFPESVSTAPACLIRTLKRTRGGVIIATNVCLIQWLTGSQHLPKSAIFKTMGYSPGLLLSVDFGPFAIHTKSSPIIPKVLGNRFGST